ncbi:MULTISPECIES: bile acid:sodium symporter [Haloprofundus]|uniref:bile acid:sodium symporter n=1 Tax=Haloprofundus TaxID=1911573 RepID=UPI001300BE99|nr:MULTISPECIES: bile acid:sodium symporter [Haloprofundus]
MERARHFDNLLLVLVTVVSGVALPGLGPYTEPLITPLVAFLVYSSLRGLRFGEISLASYGGVLALSLAISYVVLPVGGMQIASRFLSGGALTGIAIVLAVPTTTGSAIIWTRLSDGDDQLSTFISVVSLLVSPIATPLVFRSLVDSQTQTPVETMLVNLVVVVGGGIALTLLVPKRAVSSKRVDRAATLAIMVLIYSGVANLDLVSVEAAEFLPLVGVTLLLLSGGLFLSVLVGYGVRLEYATMVPLFFTSTLKNLGIALFISFSYPASMTVAAIVTYYVAQQLLSAAIADLAPTSSVTRTDERRRPR